ncbi:MAG: hypothetical protein ACR2GH_08055 [Pseudonocardia sp.]
MSVLDEQTHARELHFTHAAAFQMSLSPEDSLQLVNERIPRPPPRTDPHGHRRAVDSLPQRPHCAHYSCHRRGTDRREQPGGPLLRATNQENDPACSRRLLGTRR